MAEWTQIEDPQMAGMGDGVYARLAKTSEDRREGQVLLLDSYIRKYVRCPRAIDFDLGA